MSQIAGFSTSNFPDILNHLPDAKILELREICRDFKQQIDECPDIQVRLSHLFLSRMAHKVNIPHQDLHFEVSGGMLSVQIQSELSIHHFTHELSRVHPWIGRLAIKDCQAELLSTLLRKILFSQRLKALSLSNCSMNNAAMAQLKTLVNGNPSAPIVYLCNVTMLDGEPPANLHFPSSKRIRFIDSKEANSFCIRGLDENEKARDALERFEQEVDSLIAPPENVMAAFSQIPNFIRVRLISAVWTMTLCNPCCDLKNIDRNEIERRGVNYIRENPHDPAILAAIQFLHR
jgi:hypothetical protein